MKFKYNRKLVAHLFAAFLATCPIWGQAQTTTIVDAFSSGDNGSNGTIPSYLGMGSRINVGNTLVPAITSLDFLMGVSAGNPTVAPAPTVKVCPDAAGSPDIPGCVNFTYTGTTNPLDPSGTVWASQVYKNSYSGNFPISPLQNVWVLATADTPKTWLTSNWAGTFGVYRMALISNPAQPNTWTPFDQGSTGIPVSLYYTAAVSAPGNLTSIPTLSEFGLMLMGSLLMVFGVTHLRRRYH